MFISKEQKERAQKQGLWSDTVLEAWDALLDKLEASENPKVVWISQHFLRRLSIEAPVVIGFVTACILLHILNCTILPGISMGLFAVDDFINLTNPLMYVRFVTHIFGHSSLGHLKGNVTHLLLVGPSAEAAFGSKAILEIMLMVALSSAVAHVWFGRNHSRQLGASGVVFALILLNSLVSAKTGKIPMSFLLTACLWIGDELWKFFFAGDKTSHHAHLTGAICGTIGGYMIHKRHEQEKIRAIASKWKITKKKQ